MTDFGWADFFHGARQQPSFGSSHLQAVVSELDCVIKDVEGLKEQMASVQQPEVEGKVRAAVEAQLSNCLRRCEELHLRWQQEMTKFAEDLRMLKADDLADLRATLASHATHLTALDSDVKVLRQMAPVHGASLKATEAAVQLLKESTERAVEGLRQDIAMDQKRRAYHEEKVANQYREAEEALEQLNAELSALKKACRQTNANLLQLREAVPEALELSRDVESLKRESEHHAAKLTSISRSLSVVEDRQCMKGRDVEQIRSEVNVIKGALHHISNRGPDLTRSPEFQQLRSDISALGKRMEFHQKQGTAKMSEEVAGFRVELQHLRAEIDNMKGAKLRAIQSSERAVAGLQELGKSVDHLQQQMDTLSSKQSRLKNAVEQLRSGLPRWPGENSPQLSARLSVPVNSNRLSTPRSSRKLLVQPNSTHGLLAARNKKSPAPVPQTTPGLRGEDGLSNDQNATPSLSAAAIAVASAALSTAKANTTEYGYTRTVQAAELKPQLTPTPRTAQQQAAYVAPSTRTPSTPPAFARPTLQSPHTRGIATRRHSSAGAPLQQQDEVEHQEQQQQQMDLSQKRRVNAGLNMTQQTRTLESRKADSAPPEPTVGLQPPATPLPPSALRSARTSPSPNSHAVRVSFRDPPESSTRSISVEESEDGNTGLIAGDILNAERALLRDFANPFIGRSIGGGNSEKSKEQSSAENAIETFRNFFFFGGSESPSNTDSPAEQMPQCQPSTTALQQTKQMMEHGADQTAETVSEDGLAHVNVKDNDGGAVALHQLSETMSMSRVPVSSTCSNSTTDSSAALPGNSAHYNILQSPPDSPFRGSSPFSLGRNGEGTKEVVDERPAPLHKDVEAQSTDAALSTSCRSLECSSEKPLAAADDLRN